MAWTSTSCAALAFIVPCNDNWHGQALAVLIGVGGYGTAFLVAPGIALLAVRLTPVRRFDRPQFRLSK
jgi:hypothetical protein